MMPFSRLFVALDPSVLGYFYAICTLKQRQSTIARPNLTKSAPRRTLLIVDRESIFSVLRKLHT
jgi:hypothetical protein